MDALDNVALPLLYAGVPLKERRQRAEEALKAVGLEERILTMEELKSEDSVIAGKQRQDAKEHLAMLDTARRRGLSPVTINEVEVMGDSIESCKVSDVTWTDSSGFGVRRSAPIVIWVKLYHKTTLVMEMIKIDKEE